LFLADDTEAALRWGAAVLEREPATSVAPAALVVTSLLLERMGRLRAAIDGLRLAVHKAIEARNLPLAVAAIQDLRAFGIDASAELDRVAATFCRESDRLNGEAVSAYPEGGGFQPLSPFLAGPALASRAAQAVQTAKREHEEAAAHAAPSMLSPVPLFSSLSKEALSEVLAAFEVTTVPAGHRVIREGEIGDAAYFVARGELEISRRSTDATAAETKPPIALARLGGGAFFGETALLSKLPAPATVTAIRPSILLVARRAALEAIAAKYPEAAAELAAHCRRHTVSNLGWTSPVIASIPPGERAALVERLETRIFAKGERLCTAGEDAAGLHLIVSGEVAVVAADGAERVVLATLGAGETAGEVELVLCRKVAADAIAVRGTVTLFLQREEFFTLVQEYPAILYALYAIAVRRHNETQLALQAGSAFVADEFLELQDAGGRAPAPAEAARIVELPKVPDLPPPPPPPQAPAVTDVAHVREPARVSTRPPPPPLVSHATVPLHPPPVDAAALNGALPVIPGAPMIILQEHRGAASTSSPDTKRSKFPGHSARPERVLTPTPPPTSLSPISAALPPPSRLPLSRPVSAGRQTWRVAWVGAVAAGVLAAGFLAARDTRWGSLAAAAGAAAREPPTAAPVVPPPSQAETESATAAALGANGSAPKVTRQESGAPSPKQPAAPPQAPSPSRARVSAAPARSPSPAATSAAEAPSAPSPSASASAQASTPAAAAAPVAEAKAATPPRQADDDEFGGRK
jgi:CRP-like cAMP-binding protein